ncbi:TlpA disulfide reductase family protein [Novosphingobium sp. Gsoil 351]|uniref:TlpA family protein disulfide reductase n=1 Tax=Novosphingobium sp. Gsoil 351 TaxID=2675225 RepID=UPI001E48F845|nr:TlpA disulfide reductase family protein [Novosphingobium sp. Gsoil 351]
MPTSRSLTVLTLAAALFAGGCDRQTAEPAQPAAADSGAGGKQKTFNGTLSIENRGARMPDFALEDPAGKKLTSADLMGKPVLINLWATWCGPCVLEMPMLDQLAADGKLRVVTVSEDLQGAAKVVPFFAERKFANLEPWLDPDNTLGDHYATGILPTTVLYDKDGREVWRMIGGHDWAGPRTTAMLADTVG